MNESKHLVHTLKDIDFMDQLLLDECWLDGLFDCIPITPFQPEEIQRSSLASVMDRLIQALGHIRDKDMLIQVWVPVGQLGKRVLTTYNQPFSLDLNCSGLAHYREISASYQFAADEDSKETRGLPGRVFMNRSPEWTPDVQFFTRNEFPRVVHAQLLDVRGTLAVPVLDQGSCCLGIIEVVLTKQKIQYRSELESVRLALEAVNLKSSDVSSTQNRKNMSYQAALPEILDVLLSACTIHGLPLAQTWISCTLQEKGGRWRSNENPNNCLSSVELACHVADPCIQGFHEACSECHLLRGQGIVGKALGTNQPCFSPDVSAYNKTEYPLSHHARMFGLKAAVAMRLRSGSSDFVLEFFLPTSCVDPEEQKIMLTALTVTIQEASQTLRVVTDRELRDEESYPVMNTVCEVPKVGHLEISNNIPEQVSHWDEKSGEAFGEYSETRLGGNQPDSSSKGRVTLVGNSSTSGDNGSSLYMKHTGEKMCGKTITLEVLRQHFSGSLKDAARNLGVCPTTLKRICRHHGIQSWPSRKIKKVGHSLQKIQRVIDSVQGSSGVLQAFPELASQIASRTVNSSSSKSDNNLDMPSGGRTKRARGDANLHLSGNSGLRVVSCGPLQPAVEDKSLSRDGPRMKVMYGEDTIRFRMQRDWKYIDLLQEISRRFGVEDARGKFRLKYLDDDEEWILLTCNDDLKECVDVWRSSRAQTIKLTFIRDS